MPALAKLAETGVNYLDSSTSKPSDSFPGLMALVTGGSPRSVSAFYDVAYDRSLDPPATTTGDDHRQRSGRIARSLQVRRAAHGVPPPNSTRASTSTSSHARPRGADGGRASIDPNKLPRDPAHGCAPVFPWNFVRTNTIFGVVHAAGGYTAWSDKHPSYLSVSGPGNGTNVDDDFSPEVNSIPVGLPTVPGCNPLPDQTAVAASTAWTDSFQNIKRYDALKPAGCRERGQRAVG